MSSRENEISKIVRNPFEYQKGRVLFVEKEALRVKLVRIDAELKQLCRLLYVAIALARNDAGDVWANATDRTPTLRRKTGRGRPITHPTALLRDELHAQHCKTQSSTIFS
jgi:hypothetical protein